MHEPLRVIPSIDLRAGAVVRLQQGDFGRQIDYALDPLSLARSFARDGATLMHVVDLDGAKLGRFHQIELVARIARESGLAVQCGGGVRSEHDVAALFSAGVARVVVGTAALRDWDWFERLLDDDFYRSQRRRLVLAIDAKDGRVATHGWTHTTDTHVLDLAARVRGRPLAGLLFTDVDRDGMLGGANVELTAAIADATDVPVIASGGVGTLDHVRDLRGRGIESVILGRSLHDGRIDLKSAIAAGISS